jgi:type I restriction enzyme S subunit
MAGEWGEARLGELCDFRAGAVFKPALQGQASGEFPFVKVSDMNLPANAVRIQDANNWVSAADLRELRAKPFPPGTVVFAKIGEALRQNRLRQVARETVVDNNMMGAVPRIDRIDPQFFYYALSRFDFSDIAQGTALPYLTVSSLSGLTLDLPPASEQRAIAHILGTLDDKIELNRRMNETLEAMARALFKSWFVDFDPVRAKAEGREPGLPKPIADLFPGRLVDSELGEIPAGWGVRPIGDLAEVVGGSTPKTERFEYWENGTHHWVTPKDLSGLSMPVLLDTERRITDAGLAQIGSGLLPIGTVLLSSRAPIGYLAVAEILVAINQGFIAVKPRSGISNLFLLRWASAAHDEIVSHANGSTFLEISKSSFRPIRTVAPTTPVMHAFDRMSRPMYLKVVEHEREYRTLAVLRDTLLPRLVSGELRVKDAENFIGRAV